MVRFSAPARNKSNARRRTRRALVALGVGGAVAVTGAIGFIGLVAPHLMRPLIGHDPARLLVPSALTGAALLLAADIEARQEAALDGRVASEGPERMRVQ